ncbi:ATP-binding cassette domain-containing protein, partial [Staphylococcus capitis]|uniref:ATP-binding cassette domain-containing protein n=1 Tax=Staphylococcus capitis TaxID=29388 RepID=UPI0030BD7DBF
GPSGAGKSTIFKLIERMYPINSGYIKYGNLNIDTLCLKQWREKMGYVMQDNPMINGTVKENLLYGVEKNVNNEELIECCSLAGCH